MYEEISSAVEDNLLSDATGRNALYKIHVSLGKIVNGLNEQQEKSKFRSSSRSVTGSVAGSSVAGSVAGDEKSAVEMMMDEKTIMEEYEEEDEKDVTVMSSARKPIIKKEEITSDEDDNVAEEEEGDESDATVRQNKTDATDEASLVDELLSDEEMTDLTD